NGYSRALPNPMLLLSPAVLRESVASSNIENINTTVEQVLQMQLFPEAEQKKPDKEVLHYRDAVHWGFGSPKKVSISTRLILGVHKRLLPEHEDDYRRLQNKIANSSTGRTLYTPPPAQTIARLIGNWENFVNDRQEGIDPLIRCAIAHYQFEAIHPFLDGNGRVGRILMVLSLIQHELLTFPILYVSGYINKHRSEYYRLLREVSTKERWGAFIGFMLKGFHLQARETKGVLLKVVNLLEKTKTQMRKDHKNIYSADLVEALFEFPITTPVNLGKRLEVNYRTASRYLAQLARGKVLGESHVGKYHLFTNKPLLYLLRETQT
ncbi:MAG: Fic family protein, partial [Ignavibacteriales bacterium]|nr:Fic family protein [Ignavibacteriales bacterium]